jgi:hypothetical protein
MMQVTRDASALVGLEGRESKRWRRELELQCLGVWLHHVQHAFVASKGLVRRLSMNKACLYCSANKSSLEKRLPRTMPEGD